MGRERSHLNGSMVPGREPQEVMTCQKNSKFSDHPLDTRSLSAILGRYPKMSKECEDNTWVTQTFP